MSNGLVIYQPPNGIGEAMQQEIHSKWNTIDDALIYVLKKGLAAMTPPHIAPPLIDPHLLASASPQQYSIMYGAFEAWTSYIAEDLAELSAYLLQCENEMEQIAVHIREKIRETAEKTNTKKPSEDSIKDRVRIDPRYEELLLSHQQAKQRHIILSERREKYSRGLRLLSRNLEIRGEAAGLNGPRRPL